MNKAVLNEPKGQRLFEMYTALSHTHVATPLHVLCLAYISNKLL